MKILYLIHSIRILDNKYLKYFSVRALNKRMIQSDSGNMEKALFKLYPNEQDHRLVMTI